MTRTFDRIPRRDPRSLAFPVRRKLINRQARSYSWAHLQLDQGSEGACTGFAATTDAAARPKPVFGDPVKTTWSPEQVEYVNQIARDIYHRAKVLDEWPGEDYEGSSVTAAMSAGVEAGWWTGYEWALGPGPEAAANDVILSIGYVGPVVMGAWWRESMLDDNHRTLGPTGVYDTFVVGEEYAGGHAFLLTKYSVKRDAVWTPNSWGGGGQGWITRADLVRLLAEEGEAAIPVNRMT